MADELRDLTGIIDQALTGRGAHVLTADVLDGLDWRLAGRRVEGFPHSIFEIVRHLTFWHEYSLTWIDGQQPPAPAQAAASWPAAHAPADENEWDELIAELQSGLTAFRQRVDALDLLEERGAKTVLEIVQLIASHNSYHVGQIALLRQVMGSWPPPSGGATW